MMIQAMTILVVVSQRGLIQFIKQCLCFYYYEYVGTVEPRKIEIQGGKIGNIKSFDWLRIEW